jgi:hypothetical protein
MVTPCHHFGAEVELDEADESSLIDGTLLPEHQHQLARKPPIMYHMVVGHPHRKVEAIIHLHLQLIWPMQLVWSARAIVSAKVPNWPLDYILVAELWALWIWWEGQKVHGKAAYSVKTGRFDLSCSLHFILRSISVIFRSCCKIVTV